MRNQEIDFSLQSADRNRDIQVGLTYITVPFWDFVFKNAMIPESIPGEPADVSVVLMRVPFAMSEDKVGIDPFFERLEPGFDCIALLREKTVPKRHNLDLRALRGR
jgi:hypothetical protein